MEAFKREAGAGHLQKEIHAGTKENDGHDPLCHRMHVTWSHGWGEWVNALVKVFSDFGNRKLLPCTDCQLQANRVPIGQDELVCGTSWQQQTCTHHRPILFTSPCRSCPFWLMYITFHFVVANEYGSMLSPEMCCSSLGLLIENVHLGLMKATARHRG